MKKILVLIVLAALWALPALAQDVSAPATIKDESLLSLKRLSLGIGADYAWWSGDQSNLPSVAKEWQAGFYGAYALTPHVAAIGKVEYGLDSKVFNSALGVRVTVFRGN